MRRTLLCQGKFVAPTVEEMQTAAKNLNIRLNRENERECFPAVQRLSKAYRHIDILHDKLMKEEISKDTTYVRKELPLGENRHNAWAVRCEVTNENPSGKLKGKTIALKDNIDLKGFPLRNGTHASFIPDQDAVVVQRILDEGGKIVGKTNCEYLCLSGNSATGFTGEEGKRVQNPHKENYSAGGSSSGSGVVVATGEVDCALGGDQGGSIRIPSSLCGVYGLKPTWGLICYTGIFPIEFSIDHTGPMTRTVRDNALMLEVLAGRDEEFRDPRQANTPKTLPSYTSALDKEVKGKKIALLTEGFANCDGDVVEKVKHAADILKQLGCQVDSVSLPEHLDGPAIWSGIGGEGGLVQMMLGNGGGWNSKALFDTALMDWHANWRKHTEQFSPSLTVSMLVAEIQMSKQNNYYAKSQNLARNLRKKYDQILSKYDAIILPTTPKKASALPSEDATIAEQVSLSFEMTIHTMPFNLTEHPVMSIPIGKIEDLPVGMQVVAKHFDEPTIFTIASAWENHGDWKKY